MLQAKVMVIFISILAYSNVIFCWSYYKTRYQNQEYHVGFSTASLTGILITYNKIQLQHNCDFATFNVQIVNLKFKIKT